jgi:2-polyprenyl-3-methyl-5-hydroxy-6-metoxy-1,4-benzoquinol methylase
MNYNNLAELAKTKADREEIRQELERLARDKADKEQIAKTVEGFISGKADRKELEDLASEKVGREELERLLQAKADADQVSSIFNRLSQAKVDREEIRQELEILARSKADKEQIAKTVEGFISGKADRKELEDLASEKVDREELERLLQAKADADQVASIFNRLSQAKVEREEIKEGLDWLASVKTDNKKVEDRFQKIDYTKVDKEELENLSKNKADQREVIEIFRQVNEHKRSLIAQHHRLVLLLKEFRKRFGGEPFVPKHIETVIQEEDHLLDALYVSFEDQFRGSREDIKNRVKIYLPLIYQAGAGSDDTPVLDIGCGRGELLELFKEEGISARGVDLNRVMVNECKELGLHVEEKEAVSYLRNLPTNSLGAVTGIHVIEHLSFKKLVALFDETLRVLKPGGLAIFETPNPENLIVGSCYFYTDPSHQHPLPPNLLEFLINARGFEKHEIMRLHPHDPLKEALSAVPEIRHFFAGPMDYAVIGYKIN